jgi:PBSX family phage terminase large subunit
MTEKLQGGITGKGFVKGDPRINRNGRPKKFDQWRSLLLELGEEPATKGKELIKIQIPKTDRAGRPVVDEKGNTVFIDHYATNAEMIARAWMRDPKNQKEFIENAFGKPPDQNLIEELEKERAKGGYFSIPAELIAPDFLNSHRAVLSGLYDEFLEDGGRGSTKSTFFGYEIIALLKNNPNMHALAMRQVANTLRISVYDQLNWCINQLGLSSEFKSTISPMQITYIPTGQKIYFAGNDDPMNIKSIKPPFGYIGILWMEEVDQIKGQEAMRTVEQSIRGGEKIYRFKGWNTSKTDNNWMTKYAAVPSPRQWRHHSTYLTVPKEWLGQPWINAAEHLKEVNPKAYQHEYLGIATGSGGRIFDNLELRAITDEEIKTFDHIHYGLDFGYALDPLHWVKCHYDAGKEIVYVFDEFRAHKMKNKPLYENLVKKGMTRDNLLIADSAEPKSIADLIEYGLNVRGTEKGEGSVRYGLHWLETRVKIVVDNGRCPFLAEEMLNYEFEQAKDGTFISEYPDKNNHGIDALRYSLNLLWRQPGR